MMFELLLIFIMLSVILFIFILNYLFVEESTTLETPIPGRHIGNWRVAVPLIMVNMIFIILITYGFFNIEIFYVQGDPAIYAREDTNYSVMAYVFVMFFLIHLILLFKAGFDSWFEAFAVKSKMRRLYR